MLLLQSGVDITLIARWLGREGTATTHRYIEANLALKEQALSRIEEMPSVPLTVAVRHLQAVLDARPR